MKPIIKIEVSGYLPISVDDAKVLEYMTNMNLDGYEKLIGSKFKIEDYKPVLLRVREACELIIRKDAAVRKAAES